MFGGNNRLPNRRHGLTGRAANFGLLARVLQVQERVAAVLREQPGSPGAFSTQVRVVSSLTVEAAAAL